MTEFETSVYYKKDNQIVGAEVRVYNDNDDVIDRLLITDSTGLDDLVEKLDKLDDTYVDTTELKTALVENILGDDTVEVNAALFDGHDSSYYALSEHTHDNQFSPTQHPSNTASTYGAGTDSQYGHTRVRDDLTCKNLNISEALSSHQGYVLDQRLTTVEESNNTLSEQYYRNSMRIKIGRWSDGEGEDGTKIEVGYQADNGIYAQLYCDHPDYVFNNRDVILVLNGVPYVRTTDSNGKTGKLTINLAKGTYLLDAFVRGDEDTGVYQASDCKLIVVK